MVIMEDDQWNSKVGDTIREYFTEPLNGLPQKEDRFLLTHFTPNAFKSFIKKHRNILLIEFNPSIENSKLEIKKNVWAKPQIVVKITAKNDKEFYKAFKYRRDTIADFIMQTERARIIRAFKSVEDASIKEQLKKKYNISMVVPEGFLMAIKENNYLWLRKELNESSQGISVYFQELNDATILNPVEILKMRNLVLKNYIPGPEEGTYMTTDAVYTPTYTHVNINDMKAIEIRGLWKVENMLYGGGPFITYGIKDETHNRLIIIDGYVFAPNKAKRDFLLQVESIIYSLSIVSPQPQE